MRQYVQLALPSLSATVQFIVLLVLSANLAMAETRQIGDIELHYSVVISTFVDPEVAGRYNIVRAKDRAFLNLALRRALPDGSDVAVTAKFEGRTWDLFQNQFLSFREIREGEAIYYIADFEFSNGEIRFFDITLLPEGATTSEQFRFQKKVYEN
jgi:hypothetical protein